MAELVKAQLIELDDSGVEGSHKVEVQFNPETLKVSFANQVQTPQGKGNDKSNTSSTQFVGRGTTKLAVQLWFDVTGVLSGQLAEDAKGDVRKLTHKVVHFITPKEQGAGKDKTYLPPKLRFLWGSFKFDGIVDSLEESLEFFSPEGRPLRASINLSVVQQEIQFQFGEAAGRGAGGGRTGAGTQPLTPAPAGSTLQDLADRQGKGGSWQAIAEANSIENPRQLRPGQLVDMNAD